MQRVRRLFGVSIGVAVLGVGAMGFVLVDRAMRDAARPVLANRVTLYSDAEVLSAAISDGAINVTFTVDGLTQLWVYDGVSGALIRTVRLVE